MGVRWLAVVGIVLLAGAAWAQDNAALATQKDKVSYSIGMNIGKSLMRDAVDVDVDMVVKGLKDSYSGGATLLTEEEYRAALTGLQKEMMEKQAAATKALAEKNK